MLALKSRPWLTASLVNAVSTDADNPATLTDDKVSREKWRRLIDDQLVEWERDPLQLKDEGIDPPRPETIQRAIGLAQSWQTKGFAPPDSIVPDPNGGIVFERRENDVIERFHLWDDDTVEYLQFKGARLVVRRTL